MSTFTSTGTNEANLMKIKYGKLIDKQFNMDNVILGRIKKNTAFVGKQIDIPVIQSIGGGVGNGTLPTANVNKISKAILNDPKKLYAVTSIDRESMQASKTDEGAFVRMTKYPVQMAVKSFNRNLTRQILTGDVTGSGVLLTASTGVGTHTTTKMFLDDVDTFDVSLAEQIEIGDLVDLTDATTGVAFTTGGSANEVVDIVIVRDADSYCGTGSYIEFGTAVNAAFATGDTVHMQGSEDAELEGIKGVLAATSGSYKGITIGRRWQSYQKAAGGAVSTALLNDLVINVKRQCSESPDLLLSSFHQFIKILDLLESAKRYNLPARDKKLKGQVSFAGIEFMSADGPIPVVADRFMDAGEIYALNTNHIELHQRSGGMEWFNDDGTVFLRESTDSYEARYGGYAELFVNPHFQGVLSGLTR